MSAPTFQPGQRVRVHEGAHAGERGLVVRALSLSGGFHYDVDLTGETVRVPESNLRIQF